MKPSLRSWIFGLASAASLASARRAAADTPPSIRACIADHEQAQAAMQTSKFLSAREGFLRCATNECPALIRDDCARLAADVDNALPTIVLSARRGDVALTDVRIFIDGELVLARLHGTATPVDPGEHDIKFVTADGQSFERRIMIDEGQKRQLIVATFAATSVAPISSMASSHATSEDGGRAARRSALPFVLGAAALIGTATFAGFGLSGRAGERELSTTCGTACSPDSVDPIRTQYLVADLALGASVVLAAAAVWSYFAARPGNN